MEDGDRWKLIGSWENDTFSRGEYVYLFTHEGKPYKLHISYAFVCDGSSVPKILRGLTSMGGRGLPDEAWLPHDFFYHYKGEMPEGSFHALSDGDWQ